MMPGNYKLQSDKSALRVRLRLAMITPRRIGGLTRCHRVQIVMPRLSASLACLTL